MRFVFTHNGNDDERRARARVIERIDSLASCVHGDAGEIALCVREIDPRIVVDVIDDQTHRSIVLSARGERTLQSVLDAIATRHSPEQEAVRWVIGRPPGSAAHAQARVRSELGLDLGDEARVRAGFARGHLLELVVYSSAFGAATDERALDAAELFVVTLLGERVFDDWIGEVRVAPLPRKSLLPVLDNQSIEERTHPIAALPDLVGAAIRGIVEGLPERPLWQHAPGEEWTMFELDPEIASDYGAQDDLAIATTLAPEMLKSFLRRQPFSSERFSRLGERFCYLKIDGDGQPAEQRLLARRALEDALGESLPHAGAGAVIGNGLGVRYSYVDLALADLGAAVERVIETARSAKLPRRSWLLFCDAVLADEWIGVWDDTPAPFA